MNTLSLNDLWSFRRLPGRTLGDLPLEVPDGPSQTVSLPHTWYDDGDAYRGLAVYEKTLRRDPAWRRALLSFDGADQNCRVYVNGHFAGGHCGGYSRFRLPVPEAAYGEENWTVRVFVENAPNEDILPSFGDFTVFGGLHRPAALLVCGETCFDRCWHGTDGVIVRAAVNGAGQGVLTVEPHAAGDTADAVIAYALSDDRGAVVARAEGKPDEQAVLTVDAPEMWNGLHEARLYTLRATLIIGGKAVDEVTVRTGFRRVEIGGSEGLRLNGRAYQLRGVARHQDRAGKYSAVSEADIREDFALIGEIGANAVRLSHYQHPQAAYDCCDEAGLLCWAEIPMLKMTESPALMENARQQLTELILQNIHHPSVFCWGIQNEIAMFRDAPFMHENCRELHALVKALDPERFSAAANLYPLKPVSKLNGITDLVGYNVYFGWYYGEMSDYGAYLDRFHAVRPDLPLGISEYGVDANLALHSAQPKVKDYSEEYQALWHETVYPQIESRPWLWGSFIWNMFDFSSARRNEGGQRFINAKGLVTHDRRIRKDAFYYYKARWTDAPFLHLCGRRFSHRAEERASVKCYTNLPRVALRVNGEPFGEAETQNGAAAFENVPLRMGENRISVTAGECADECVWTRAEAPDPAYCLPEEEGGPVRNWFLDENDERREGYFSIQDTANDLLESPDARRVLEKYIPDLVRVMTEKNVIPLGLTLKSILAHDRDGEPDVSALNRELNEIPND